MDYSSDDADWVAEQLPEGWDLLSNNAGAAFQVELDRELSSGHELFGLTLTPVATCVGCDETLFFVEDLGAWALVHLTWRQSAEPPPWPDSVCGVSC